MDSKLPGTLRESSGPLPLAAEPQTLDLFAYCYEDRFEMLPQLTAAFVRCGGWVLERRTISATAMDYRFEIQLSGVIDLYGALLALGIELTRDAHGTLTDLCNCYRHASFAMSLGQILSFRLDIQFMADASLNSLWPSATRSRN